MKAFQWGALGFYFPILKIASVYISVLDINVINQTDIIAVIIIAVIYLLLLLVWENNFTVKKSNVVERNLVKLVENVGLALVCILFCFLGITVYGVFCQKK